MKRKTLISTLLVFALMLNLTVGVIATDTGLTPIDITQTETVPGPTEDNLNAIEPTEGFDLTPSIQEVEDTSVPEPVPTEDTTLENTESTESSPDEIEATEVPQDTPPTLAASNTWIRKHFETYTITEINIIDSVDASLIDSATESWPAAEDADEDGSNDSDIMCYVNDTTLTISGNGSGKILANPNSEYAFNFSRVTVINGLDLLDTRNVTDMHAMFNFCKKLTTLDLSSWDTSNVTDMAEMFSASGFTTLDLSGWDTSNVTDMSNMFQNNLDLTTLDLSGWDTSNVTDMAYMFSKCISIKTIDLSSWDTSNVTNMHAMFYNCSGFTTLDLSGWDTSNVTDMTTMFSRCINLETLNISNFNTSSIATTDLNCFASRCSSLTTIILGENFGQSGTLPIPGPSGASLGYATGMFFYEYDCYTADQLVTVVYGANDVMKAYDWATDKRIVSFATSESEGEDATAPEEIPEISVNSNNNTPPISTPSYSSNGNSGGSFGGGAGGGGSVSKVTSPKADNSDKEVIKGTAIELSTSTKDAKIYYTVDGSNPTTSSTLYSAPIVLTEDVTIKMVAVKENMTNSSVVTVSYKVRDAKIETKDNVAAIPYMALRQDNTFAPDEAATRYEVINALAYLFNIEEIEIVNEFNDVNAENAELVALFSGASIINGYPDGTFGGEKGITRAEFIKILTIMLGLDDVAEDIEGLNDIENHWAKDYILRFLKQGYIQGYPDGSFRPDDNISRAEVVTIINRIIDSSVKDVTVAEDVAENHWAYNEIKNAVIVNQ